MRRRVLALLVVMGCVVGVVAYQVTTPTRAPARPDVFVPSVRFFSEFSPSFRTSIADAYYLQMIQYYGEHVKSDGRLDSLPQMVDLVTSLSPHFTRAFLFSAFALMDAGRSDMSYEVLKRGHEANPDEWHFPAYLGYLVYAYASNEDKDAIAADWYLKAAAVPGRPAYIPRLAAALLSKGGKTKKAILMWGQVYAAGDKYSRQKAVDGLSRMLPAQKEARMKALAPLVGTIPEAELDQLIAELFKDYK